MIDEKQRPRPPLLVAQIGFLHTILLKECDKVFREQDFPLEMDQLPVLMSLYYSGWASQQEMCSKLLRDKASINRTVAFFVKKGIVTTTPDSADKRKTRIELTAAGKKLAQKGNTIIEKYDEKLSAVFTTDEKREFHRLMYLLIERNPFNDSRLP